MNLGKSYGPHIFEMIEEDFSSLIKSLKNRYGFSYIQLFERTNLSPAFLYRLCQRYRGCELRTKINFLINGFGMEKVVIEYLEWLLSQKERLKS